MARCRHTQHGVTAGAAESSPRRPRPAGEHRVLPRSCIKPLSGRPSQQGRCARQWRISSFLLGREINHASRYHVTSEG